MDATNPTVANDRLLTATEAANLLEVTRLTFEVFAEREDFPQPAITSEDGDQWKESDMWAFRQKASVRSPYWNAVYGLITIDWQSHEMQMEGMRGEYGVWEDDDADSDPYLLLHWGAEAEKEGKHTRYLMYRAEEGKMELYDREAFEEHAFDHDLDTPSAEEAAAMMPSWEVCHWFDGFRDVNFTGLLYMARHEGFPSPCCTTERGLQWSRKDLDRYGQQVRESMEKYIASRTTAGGEQ